MLNATKGLVIKTKYAALRKLRQNMIDDFKEEFDVVRITPRLLNEVLAAERAAERTGQF
jgi:predicted nucleic acid-binding protein